MKNGRASCCPEPWPAPKRERGNEERLNEDWGNEEWVNNKRVNEIREWGARYGNEQTMGKGKGEWEQMMGKEGAHVKRQTQHEHNVERKGRKMKGTQGEGTTQQSTPPDDCHQPLGRFFTHSARTTKKDDQALRG